MSDFQSLPIVDADVIQSLKDLGGDEDPGLFVEVVDLFLADAQKRLQVLERALASGDVKLLERTAHSLKSASANVGALRFSKLCFEIELRGRQAKTDGVCELVGEAARLYAESRSALEALKA
jgi:HPt (histidine-containing phosphotransfer) domain-containing protein